jgi:hypothetical protein
MMAVRMFSVVVILCCLGQPLALAQDAVVMPTTSTSRDDKEFSSHILMAKQNNQQRHALNVTKETTSMSLEDLMEDDDNHHHNHHHDHDDSKNNTFCSGMYMSVFMDGFRWSLGVNKDSSHHTHNNSSTSLLPPCLAYYVRSWKLSVSGKFRGAMLFSFLMALLTEGLAASRFAVIDWLRYYPTLQRHRKVALTAVYALQSWLGTLIMLVAMMYSIEMLLSVIAGLMVGNYLFVRDHKQKLVNDNNNHHRGTTTTTRTTAFEEERLLLLSSSARSLRVDDADSTGGLDSVGGMGSIDGLQMATKKEE